MRHQSVVGNGLRSALWAGALLWPVLWGSAVRADDPLEGSPPDTASASEEEDPVDAMREKVETLLKELDVLYKTSQSSSGNKIFVVMWDDGNEASKLTLSVKRAGTYGGMPLYVVYAYTPVVSLESGHKLTEEVVQTVAASTDDLTLGSYSTSEDLTSVYSNTSAFINQMSKAELWMCLAHAHQNRVDMKQKLAKLDSTEE